MLDCFWIGINLRVSELEADYNVVRCWTWLARGLFRACYASCVGMYRMDRASCGSLTNVSECLAGMDTPLYEQLDLQAEVVYEREYQQVQMEEVTEELDFETAMDIALAQSMEEGGIPYDIDADVGELGDLNTARKSSRDEAQGTLPSNCTLIGIEPGGWCFYDSVLAHLQEPLPVNVDRYALAAAILECLARQRSVFEPQMTCDDVESLHRRDDVFHQEDDCIYFTVADQLDDFDVYFLSKLEMCCERRSVLDTRNYADDPEIRAFLQACNLSMLRLRPPSCWTDNSVGSIIWPGGVYQNFNTMDQIHAVVEQGGVDLGFLHYQFNGFEHFDVLRFNDLADASNAMMSSRVIDFVTASELARAMSLGDLDTVRRTAIEVLGKTIPELQMSDSSVTVSSDDESSESGSDVSDDGVQQEHEGVPMPPPACSQVPRHTRVCKGAKFCQTYTMGRQCARDNEKTINDDDASTISSVSDDSDLFNTSVDPDKTWTTEQDRDQEQIERIAQLLRKRPLLPPHPDDAREDWTDVDSGVAFPRAHCAFSNCRWTSDIDGRWERFLAGHIRKMHLKDMGLGDLDKADYMAFYCAAIRAREQESMPAVGLSIDRRTFKLLADIYNSKVVYNLICFVCAQSKTHTGLKSWDEKVQLSEISYVTGRWLGKVFQRNPRNSDLVLGMATYLERYASAPDSSMTDAPEVHVDNWEWKRLLQLPGTAPILLI